MRPSTRSATDGRSEEPSVSGVGGEIASPTSWLATIIVTGLLIFGVWAAYLTVLDQGGISQYDEFYTLDRSAGFARHDDWLTVYSNNKPTFKKPPLQYWMSGFLLEAGFSTTMALRLPSMLFSLGMLVTTAWLAAILLPAKRWAVPAAVILCACSTQFWLYSTSAMLETGAAFFATLALIATIKALRNPIWWYGTAVVVGLGALQKAPIGLVMVALFICILHLTKSLHGFSYGRLRESPHFIRALRLTICLCLAWPLLQLVQQGEEDAFKQFFGDEMFKRFAPTTASDNSRSLNDIWKLVISGEPFLRVPAIIALLWLPWRLGRLEFLPLPGILLAFFLAMWLAGGVVFPRYSLSFVPLLAASLAVLSFSLFRAQWIGLVATLTIVALLGGPMRSSGELRLEQGSHITSSIEALTALGQELEPQETLVLCNWPRKKKIPTGAISYYGATNGRPFIAPSSLERFKRSLEKGRIQGALRGACRAEQLDEIAFALSDLELGPSHGELLFWTAFAPD